MLKRSSMPRKKEVQALQRLCLENVAGNMSCLWLKDYADKYLDEYHFRYIMGPFSELAGSVVQELLQLMGQSGRLTRPMLHLLLVPHLTQLSLSTCPKLVTKAIADIITVRCKNLSSLDLRGCSRIPADSLVDLAEILPGLTKLNLSGTQCNTAVLSAVGSSCRRLRELDVSACARLSGASLLYLAYDPIAGAFCCPALQALAASDLEPSASSQDLLWSLVFLLLALPSLKSLASSLVPDAVCLVHHQEFGGAQIPPEFPSLEELARRHRAPSFTGEGSAKLTLPLREMLEVSEDSLPAICAACPHVARATVILEDGPAKGKSPLLSWHRLAHLTLSCQGNRHLGELLPLATAQGSQLQTLSLGGFSLEDPLSFPTLLSRCPNLRELSASFCAPQLPGWHWEPLANGDGGLDVSLVPLDKFPRLRAFRLILAASDAPLPSPHSAVLSATLLSLLRNSPCLETLELIHVPFPLDGLLQKALETPGTPLAHLHKVSLAHSQVSAQTAHLLLSSENQLGHLDLQGCPDVTRGDHDQLLRRVHRERMDLLVLWR
ncbi:Hypothetical predicted protein [Podarcis lilfordi]|uniref:F-box/LRR-repeat protein 15-like leucin rich repeat domain-containing protein n=2 Tax=Podarcis lilfordi TaxID=74358 RepID=A0AA35KVC5_9SAUR|nr:Hypothetical predicted protein [Podarcis lilfordi]